MSNKEKLKEVLKELKAEAKDMINLGDSREKSEGYGMMYVIKEVNKIINKG
jgi:hypothetical protein